MTQTQKAVGEEFAVRLRRLRRERGLSQVDLAEAAETSQRTISSYETGLAVPTATILIRLTQVLGVSADELLGLKKVRIAEEMDRPTSHLWAKFKRIRALPTEDQRAIFRVINMALKSAGGDEGEEEEEDVG